ncbi:MAG: anthranilate synthase component I, partial [Isosphaeraceae bacterium]
MNCHRPTFEEFARWAGTAPCVPVYRQLTGDGLTPVSAFGRIERSAPSFLFESVIGGEKVGRFSFLGTEPFLR